MSEHIHPSTQESKPRKAHGNKLVNRIETGLEIVFLSFALVVFNVYPEKVGVITSLNEPVTFVPLLAPGFLDHMPSLNLLWGLSLALALTVFTGGYWRPSLRWAQWGLQLFTITVIIRLLRGGPLVGINPAWVTSPAADVAAWQTTLIPVLNIVVQVLLWVALLGTAVAAIQSLLAILRELGEPA